MSSALCAEPVGKDVASDESPAAVNTPVYMSEKTRQWLLYAGQIVVLSLFYWVSGQLSFSLSVSHSIVTLVVFAAEGFALAATIIFGKRLWPGVFLGQLLLALSNHLAWPLAIAISAVNSAEAVLGAHLFLRLRLQRHLERMRDVSGLLLLIVVVLQPFSATLGNAVLWLGGVVPSAELGYSWLSWWLGNSLGQILIVPLLLSLRRTDKVKMYWYEAVLTVLPILSAGWLIFRGPQFGSVTIAFALTTPLLVLLAVRRGMTAVTLGVALIAIIALYNTHMMVGPFVSGRDTLMLDLNIFLLGTALTAQFVAALFAERKMAEEKLRLAASVFASSGESVMICDANNIIIDINPAFTRATGYERDEVLGRAPALLNSGRHERDFFTLMWRVLAETGSWHGEIWNRNKAGALYPTLMSLATVRDSEKHVTHYVGVFSDISLLKAHEAELEHTTLFDELTGLPNRRLLHDRLRQATASCRRSEKLVALCYLDLDGFKQVNDTLGHQAGDQLLIEIARRFESNLRVGDTVARLGGDEFVIVLPGLAQVDECEMLLKRLIAAVSIPVTMGDKTASVSVSIGVTFYPSDTSDIETLLRHADESMYRAKQRGKGQYVIFDLAQG